MADGGVVYLVVARGEIFWLESVMSGRERICRGDFVPLFMKSGLKKCRG